MTDSKYRNLYEQSPDKAQRALFDEYLNYVYSIVYNKLRSCGNREDIEECVGDVFAAVFMSYDKNGGFDGDLKGLIGTIAFRKAVQAFRKLSNPHGFVTSEEEFFNIGGFGSYEQGMKDMVDLIMENYDGFLNGLYRSEFKQFIERITRKAAGE